MPRRPATRLRLTNLEDRLTPAGGLDTSFGTGGIVTTAPGGYGTPSSVAAQPDGHLLVLAPSVSPGSTVMALTRYNADGSLDTAFGTNGVVPAAGGVDLVAPNLAVQADGKIVLAGGATRVSPGTPTPWLRTVTVVRLNADGSPDATFGTNGVVELGTESPYQRHGVAVLAGGSIVLTGTAYPGGDPNVAHDDSFTYTVLSRAGVVGATTTFVGPPSYALAPYNQAVSATPTPDGGALLLYTLSGFGPAGPPQTTVALVKLTAGGVTDAGFDGDGVWSGVLGNGNGQGLSLAVQPDGKVLMTSILTPTSPNGVTQSDLAVLRLNADGSRDTSFGGDGEVTALPGGGYAGYAGVALLPDGRVVVSSGRVTSSDAGVAVLNPDGTPDDYFADGSGVSGVRVGTGNTTVGSVAVSGSRVIVLVTVGTVYDVGGSYHGLAALTEGPTAFVPPPPVVPPPPGEEPGRGVIESAPGGQIIGELPATTGGTPPPAPGGPPVSGLSPVYSVPGDLNGDGFVDKIVTDGPRVSVVSGKDDSVLVEAFAPFEASYTGALNAVFVDVDGDGKSELVVSPGQGGGPVVAVYNADGTQRGRFWGLDDDEDFRGGLNLTAGDVNSDGRPDLVVAAGAGGGPRVAIFDGNTLGATAKRLVADFFAFEATQTGGFTATFADGTVVFGAGPGGGPRVRGVYASGLLAGVKSLDDLPAAAVRYDKFAGDPASRGGVTLSVRPGTQKPTVSSPDLPYTIYQREVAADGGDGKPEVVFGFDGLKVEPQLPFGHA